MKVCIAGKNAVAVTCTDHLINEGLVPLHDLCVCFNRTDTGKDSFQPSFRRYCQERHLEEVCLQELFDTADLKLISLEFDRIIPCDRFKSKHLFNIHFSLLPKYKGMYTSAWPILNGETHSGVTLHVIDAGIDTGPIIDQVQFNIYNDDTCRDLYQEYTSHGITLFKRNIGNLLAGQYNAVKQKAAFASYYAKDSIDYSNIVINVNKTAFEVRNQIRAFTFKEYQLPQLSGYSITSAEILAS